MRRFGLSVIITFLVLTVGCSENTSKLNTNPTSTSLTTLTTIPIYDPVGKQLHDIEHFYTLQRERIKRDKLLVHSYRVSSVGQAVTISEISNETWWRLFGCETGQTFNAAINTGNGYYGAFQFSLSTWRSVGGSGYPHEYAYEIQRDFAIKLQQRDGWGAWPRCSRMLGLR